MYSLVEFTWKTFSVDFYIDYNFFLIQVFLNMWLKMLSRIVNSVVEHWVWYQRVPSSNPSISRSIFWELNSKCCLYLMVTSYQITLQRRRTSTSTDMRWDSRISICLPTTIYKETISFLILSIILTPYSLKPKNLTTYFYLLYLSNVKLQMCGRQNEIFKENNCEGCLGEHFMWENFAIIL